MKGQKLGGISKILRAKYNIYPTFSKKFNSSEYNSYQYEEESFKLTELRHIQKGLPLREMDILLALRWHPAVLRIKYGSKSFFTPEDKVTLAFLKRYATLVITDKLKRREAHKLSAIKTGKKRSLPYICRRIGKILEKEYKNDRIY